MRYLLLVLCLWLCAIPSHAGDALPGAGGNTAMLSGAQPEFLPVEKAYPLAARISGGQIQLQWDITPGYYLYKVRMGISLAGAGSAPTALDVAWPAGEPHEDEFLGATEIYRGRLEVTHATLRGGSREGHRDGSRSRRARCGAR